MAEEFEQYSIDPIYDGDDYLKMLKGLLPRGFIWGWDNLDFPQLIQDVISGAIEWQDNKSTGTEIQDTKDLTGSASGNLVGRYLSVIASELERLEIKSWQLLNESDPGVAIDLLPDWERVLGLPGNCVTVSQNITERQRAAHAKLFDEYKTSNEQFYIDYAATLGFTITIDETPAIAEPTISGVAICGRNRCGSGFGGNSVMEITITAGTGNLAYLQCIFGEIKQAHVIILWVDARP
jgi:hypothetical protein